MLGRHLCFPLLVAASLFGTPSYSYFQFGQYLVQNDRYFYGESQNGWYSIVTVISQEEEVDPHHLFTLGTAPTDENVQRFLEYMDQWIDFSFADRGVAPPGSARQEALRKTGSLKDRRSSFVVITNYNDLNAIKAMIRVQRLGREPKVPLSLEAHIQLSRPGFELPREVLKLVKEGDQMVVEGDIAEIKNFIQNPNSEYDFIPLLFWKALKEGLFDAGLRTIEFAGEKYPYVPSKYYIHIDAKTDKLAREKMVRYYSFLGFKVFQTFPESQSAVMVIDRSDLLKIEEKFSRRPGQALIEFQNFMYPHSGWEWHPFEPFSCEEALSQTRRNIFFAMNPLSLPSQPVTPRQVLHDNIRAWNAGHRHP